MVKECPESNTGFLEITRLLQIVKEKNASDLHLVSGMRPVIRESSRLLPLSDEPVCGAKVKQLLCAVLTARQRQVLDENLSVDSAISIPDIGRFRIHGYYQQGNVTAVFRRLSDHLPVFGTLGLPESVAELIHLRAGLVLVTGATGSGKSTTLAAIIDEINATSSRNIITIEDPIEYVHFNNKCIINQRELHTDVPSFSDALRASLRADPDIILVGEMRDLETIRTAVMAAETGHLVFSTLHSRDAVSSITRLVGVFNPEEQQQIRQQLSVSLKMVVSQQLLPRKGEMGVIMAAEVMKVTPAISNLIRLGKQDHIYMAIETGTYLGMQTMEQCLVKLVRSGAIDVQTAEKAAKSADLIRKRI
jgi:twitching motility protein PilT